MLYVGILLRRGRSFKENDIFKNDFGDFRKFGQDSKHARIFGKYMRIEAEKMKRCEAFWIKIVYGTGAEIDFVRRWGWTHYAEVCGIAKHVADVRPIYRHMWESGGKGGREKRKIWNILNKNSLLDRWWVCIWACKCGTYRHTWESGGKGGREKSGI